MTSEITVTDAERESKAAYLARDRFFSQVGEIFAAKMAAAKREYARWFAGLRTADWEGIRVKVGSDGLVARHPDTFSDGHKNPRSVVGALKVLNGELFDVHQGRAGTPSEARVLAREFLALPPTPSLTRFGAGL